jgi:hypothetical protein
LRRESESFAPQGMLSSPQNARCYQMPFTFHCSAIVFGGLAGST